MRKSDAPAVAAVAALLAVFAAGVAWLFVLRFDAGDVFPVYSSLRADPLGTKALYESLGGLDGLSVARSFKPRPEAPGEPATVLCLGARDGDVHDIPVDRARGLEAIAAGGGRLVVAFYPVRPKPPGTDNASPGEPRGHGAKGACANAAPARTAPGNADCDDGPCGPSSRRTCLTTRWGFACRHAPLADNAAGRAGRPAWRSTLVFDGSDDAWRVSRRRDGHPVVMERAFGAGTIVLAADTYVFSNEAMARDRDPGLLAWIVGTPRRIVFDEGHLGVAQERGVAALARKYRLHGILPGVVLLAGLFVWKNASSFPPRRRAAVSDGSGHAAGRDSGEAFLNLLRRNIPPREILRACLDEWARSFPRALPEGSETLSRARAAAAGRQDPVDGYRRIAQILKGENP